MTKTFENIVIVDDSPAFAHGVYLATLAVLKSANILGIGQTEPQMRWLRTEEQYIHQMEEWRFYLGENIPPSMIGGALFFLDSNLKCQYAMDDPFRRVGLETHRTAQNSKRLTQDLEQLQRNRKWPIALIGISGDSDQIGWRSSDDQRGVFTTYPNSWVGKGNSETNGLMKQAVLKRGFKPGVISLIADTILDSEAIISEQFSFREVNIARMTDHFFNAVLKAHSYIEGLI